MISSDNILTNHGMKSYLAGIGLVLLLFGGCIDPVEPDFKYRQGLVFVEGFASTAPGTTFVVVNESANEFGIDVVNFVSGATVVIKERDSGREVELDEIPGAYVAPEDFAVLPGESWMLDIRLEDGGHYQSAFETVAAAVPITDINATYKPRLQYREASEKYVPGHQILVDFQDPGDSDNYYYWRYRTFENLDECELCYEGLFRNGKCVGELPGDFFEEYYNYQCETDCWKIRYPESVDISDDRFINGRTVTNRIAANVLLYTKEDMVVELQQLNISPKAYEYYEVLKDIVDNNSGLNAPPPAALIGNLIDVDNDENFVFGRFTVASSSLAYLFIDRSGIDEAAIESTMLINREGCEVCPPGSGCPIGCTPVPTAPCSETRYRTSLMPQGWIDQ